MRKNFIITLLVLFYCFFSLREATAFWVWTPQSKKLVNPKYAAKDTPEEQFKWAMKFYKKKDYKRAAEEFTRLTAYFKDSTFAPEAQYYAGRSYEASEKYYPAFESYQKTIDLYPFTKRINEVIEREYNLGIRLYKKHGGLLMGMEIMTDLDRAAEIFQKVRDNAPFGEYGDDAQYMIGECKKKATLYDEAKIAFQKVVDEYPRSMLAEKAKYQVAQCTYLASLKPEYDQELTDKAIEEFETIAETKRGLDVSEEAKEAISLLEDKKAESIFSTAKFYERHRHYKSADIYYREVIRIYPRSSFSDLALERLKHVEKILKKKK